MSQPIILTVNVDCFCKIYLDLYISPRVKLIGAICLSKSNLYNTLSEIFQ